MRGAKSKLGQRQGMSKSEMIGPCRYPRHTAGGRQIFARHAENFSYRKTSDSAIGGLPSGHRTSLSSRHGFRVATAIPRAARFATTLGSAGRQRQAASNASVGLCRPVFAYFDLFPDRTAVGARFMGLSPKRGAPRPVAPGNYFQRTVGAVAKGIGFVRPGGGKRRTTPP